MEEAKRGRTRRREGKGAHRGQRADSPSTTTGLSGKDNHDTGSGGGLSEELGGAVGQRTQGQGPTETLQGAHQEGPGGLQEPIETHHFGDGPARDREDRAPGFPGGQRGPRHEWRLLPVSLRPAIGRPHSLQVPKFPGPPKDSPEPGLPGPGPHAVDEQPETSYQSSQIHASHPAPQAIRSNREPQRRDIEGPQWG
jgi:hypothetical protein